MPEASVRELEDLELDEVSFVDVPANPGAHVLLVKRDAKASKAVGVKFVVGYRANGSSDVVSVIFDSDSWEKQTAKQWLTDHGFSDTNQQEDAFKFLQPCWTEQFDTVRTFHAGDSLAKALSEDTGWRQIERVLSESLARRFAASDDEHVFVRDIWKDDLIFERYPGGGIFRVSYNLSTHHFGVEAQFGEPVPVRVVYVDATEAKGGGSKDDDEEDRRRARIVRRVARVRYGVSRLTEQQL